MNLYIGSNTSRFIIYEDLVPVFEFTYELKRVSNAQSGRWYANHSPFL
jgi:hypothetical protein